MQPGTVWRSFPSGSAVRCRSRLLAAALAALAGCGLTKSRTATEQLVVSDAVDRAVAAVDFSPLSGQKVYFDARFVDKAKGMGFANSDYVLSSLRQQLLAYNCRLQERLEDADYVVEPRIGALGQDGYEVNFGLPASAALSAASIPLQIPATPLIPEISIGRRNHQLGAAKIGVFAYHRETGRPIWQAGVATATSNAKDLWILGLGPYRRGSLYRRLGTADELVPLPVQTREQHYDPLAAYSGDAVFAPSAENVPAAARRVSSEEEPPPRPQPAPAETSPEPARLNRPWTNQELPLPASRVPPGLSLPGS